MIHLCLVITVHSTYRIKQASQQITFDVIHLIDIILFSIIIFQLIIFLSEFKLQRKKFIPLFFTAIGAIIFCILALTKVVELNWPIIVLGGVGVLSLIILLVFYHKRVIKDLTKYFSIK